MPKRQVLFPNELADRTVEASMSRMADLITEISRMRACACAGESAARDDMTIDLETAATFPAADGQEIELTPGMYRAQPAGHTHFKSAR